MATGMTLKTWMKVKSVGTVALADALGVHRTTIIHYLSGRRRPGLEIVAAIEEMTKGKVRLQDWLGRA